MPKRACTSPPRSQAHAGAAIITKRKWRLLFRFEVQHTTVHWSTVLREEGPCHCKRSLISTLNVCTYSMLPSNLEPRARSLPPPTITYRFFKIQGTSTVWGRRGEPLQHRSQYEGLCEGHMPLFARGTKTTRYAPKSVLRQKHIELCRANEGSGHFGDCERVIACHWGLGEGFSRRNRKGSR